MSQTFRVLTLNCWNVSPPFEERMALIRDGIEALQPDLIGLQEIIVRRDGFDQAAIILEGLGYERVFGPAFRWDEAGPARADQPADAFGNVIASRWPLRRTAVAVLPEMASEESRSVTTALVEAPFGVIPFATTHLNWKLHHGFAREAQVVAVAERVERLAGEGTCPPLLVGDMNADPDSTEVRFLCGLATLQGRSTYLQDTWRVAGDGSAGYTWDNRNRFAALSFEPNRRIDYIFAGLADPHTGRGWVESVRLAFTQPTDGVFPTDHFGLVADIRV